MDFNEYRKHGECIFQLIPFNSHFKHLTYEYLMCTIQNSELPFYLREFHFMVSNKSAEIYTF